MTLTLRYEPRFRSLGWLWSVALFLPFLLGAGLLEESPHGPVLPLTESYRTPLSKTIYGDAADWRASTSQEEEMDWRKPKDSENDWRTKSRQAPYTPDTFGCYQTIKLKKILSMITAIREHPITSRSCNLTFEDRSKYQART